MLPKLLLLTALSSSLQIKVLQIIIIKIDFPHYPWKQPVNTRNQLFHPVPIIRKLIPLVETIKHTAKLSPLRLNLR